MIHMRRLAICGTVMRAAGLVLTGLLAATVAHGQEAPIVTAKAMSSTEGAHPGSTVKMAVEAEIATGYHINDHHPSLDYLIPTELKLDPGKGISVEKLVYPKGEPVKLAFSDQPLSVYQGTLVIGAMLRLAPGLPPGAYSLKGKLDYQACNDHACLPPASIPVVVTVKVVDKGVPVKRVNADVFSHIQFN